MAIFLKILSVLGITILVIIGILIALILIVLLVPVRYRGKVKLNGSLEKAEVSFSWLLHLVRGNFIYPEPATLTVKVLFFTLIPKKVSQNAKPAEEEGSTDSEEGVKPEGEAAEDEAVKPEEAPEAEDPAEGSAEESSEEKPSNGEPSEAESNDTEGSEAGSPEGEECASETSGDAEHSEDESSTETPAFLGKLRYTFRKIYGKISLIVREKDYYLSLLSSDDVHKLLHKGKKHLKAMLVSVFPRKLHAKLLYGMSTPDLTGYIFGLYCLLAKRFDRSSEVVPDFEREVLEGEASFKGRILAGTFVHHGLCLVCTPALWRLKKRLGKHKKAMEAAKDREKKELSEYAGELRVKEG